MRGNNGEEFHLTHVYEQFYDLLHKFDKFFDQTDDTVVYARGENQLIGLRSLAHELSMLPEDFENKTGYKL